MLALLFSLPAVAQSVPIQESADKEQQAAKKALEQKALALLEDVVSDAQTLKSTTNRLRIQATVADLLWSRDEARARALMKETMKEFVGILSGIDVTDNQYYLAVQGPTQLRQEILQILARHDGQMALDFLRTSHIPQQANASVQGYDYENQMEMQLAYQIVNNNPKLALQIALESMDRGFSYNLVNLIPQLREKDREGAARLASEIVKRLQSENILMNQEAAGVAVNLLLMAKGAESHGSSSKPLQTASSAPLLDAQAYRDLMDLVLNAATKAQTTFNPSDWKARNAAQNLLGGLPPLMSEIEKYAPGSAITLRRKISEFNKQSLDPSSRMWQEYQEVFQNGSVDEILAVAPKIPLEQRNQVYQQAAWKAFNQGDAERARQIVNDDLSNPVERHQLLEQFDRQTAMKAMGEGKSELARLLLPRLRNIEDRAMMLIQFATAAASKGDKRTATQLLEEARTLFGSRAENSNQLNTILYIARAYATLDAARSFEIIEQTVGQLNDLLAAAEVLNGFDQQYYRDGELVWQGSNLSNMVNQTAADLGQLARTDFDHARESAGKFQRPEARLMAWLSIAQAVLSDTAYLNRPIEGRRIMSLSQSVYVVNK
jgi:hypothetical protein